MGSEDLELSEIEKAVVDQFDRVIMIGLWGDRCPDPDIECCSCEAWCKLDELVGSE